VRRAEPGTSTTIAGTPWVPAIFFASSFASRRAISGAIGRARWLDNRPSPP